VACCTHKSRGLDTAKLRQRDIEGEKEAHAPKRKKGGVLLRGRKKDSEVLLRRKGRSFTQREKEKAPGWNGGGKKDGADLERAWRKKKTGLLHVFGESPIRRGPPEDAQEASGENAGGGVKI